MIDSINYQIERSIRDSVVFADNKTAVYGQQNKFGQFVSLERPRFS